MSFASVLIAAVAATMLAVSPWRGADLPTASQAAAKYRLVIRSTPRTTVELHAERIANGWLAAFCTSRMCSPMRTSVDIPASGRAVIQFELIRQADSAPKRSGARIVTGDGATVLVPPSRR